MARFTFTRDTENRLIRAAGRNDSVLQKYSHFDFLWSIHSDCPDWNRCRVAGTDGLVYDVWVPNENASNYQQDDLVEFQCRWVRWKSEWYLVAVRGRVYRIDGTPATERLARVGRTLRCEYCGDKLNHDATEWRFNDS